MLGFLIHVPGALGYPVLFGIIAGESAGLLLPGETALIVAGTLASQGKLSLSTVIAVAAAGAIVGDNIGYLFGRTGLQRLLARPGRTATVRRNAVRHAETFFDRYGAFAVFIGRWIPGLRLTAAWAAGLTHMPWPRFLIWNALGGIAWAATVGGAAYELGSRVSGALGTVGLGAIGLILLGFGVRSVLRIVREHKNAANEATLNEITAADKPI